MSVLRERPSRRLAHLTAVTEIVIRDDTRHHRLADRNRANADAGVVAPLGHDLGLVAVAVDGQTRRDDRRCRLYGKAGDDRLPRGYAAENPSGVVRQEARLAIISHPHLIGVLLACEGGGAKSGTDLD